MAKAAVLREVRTLNVACDAVGNLLLLKFAHTGGTYSTVFFPADIVFWMLRHIPVNQNPALPVPPQPPAFTEADWDERFTPRALSVNCKQLPGGLRMTVELLNTPEQTVLLNLSCLELLRRYFEGYSKDLIDLDAA